MKYLVYILLVISVSCSGKRTDQKNIINNQEEFWTEFKSKDSIPELLNLTLKEINHGEFDIANPNEDFEVTDVIITDSLPNRQLRLLSRKNDCWRITYIQGGFVKYYVYAECKLQNDSISDFQIAHSTLHLENNDSIDKYLTEKKLELHNINVSVK